MTDWTKKKYDEYYNAYVPWLEDKYLAWFGENKTSYTAKGNLEKIHLSFNPPIQHFPLFASLLLLPNDHSFKHLPLISTPPNRPTRQNQTHRQLLRRRRPRWRQHGRFRAVQIRRLVRRGWGFGF